MGCKMKLVIILLSCLVGISYQEAYNHYMPFNPILYYYAPAPIRQIVPQGRTPFQVEDGDARFFFNSLTNINIRLAKTSTLTSYVFSTSVATQVVNGGPCLQVALFADQAAAGTRCRRRRELAEFSDKIDVSPTPVVPIQASAIVAELSEKNDFVQPIESSHAEVIDKEYEIRESVPPLPHFVHDDYFDADHVLVLDDYSHRDSGK